MTVHKIPYGSNLCGQNMLGFCKNIETLPVLAKVVVQYLYQFNNPSILVHFFVQRTNNFIAPFSSKSKQTKDSFFGDKKFD